MQTTIVVRSGKFSITGFMYYMKHRKMFTNQSVAIILTIAKEGIAPKSISVAVKEILVDEVWLFRNKSRIKITPETEVQEGDLLLFWFPNGYMIHEVQNDALQLVRLVRC